jgi:hypothetical protein
MRCILDASTMHPAEARMCHVRHTAGACAQLCMRRSCACRLQTSLQHCDLYRLVSSLDHCCPHTASSLPARMHHCCSVPACLQHHSSPQLRTQQGTISMHLHARRTAPQHPCSPGAVRPPPPALLTRDFTASMQCMVCAPVHPPPPF